MITFNDMLSGIFPKYFTVFFPNISQFFLYINFLGEIKICKREKNILLNIEFHHSP